MWKQWRLEPLAFGLVLLLWLGGWGLPAGAIAAVQEPAADPQQVLRSRAEQLFRLLQMRQFSQAEEYLTKDSIEAFRKQTNGPFLSFQVSSVKIKPGGQTATAVIDLTLMAPGIPMPMVYPRSTAWRQEEGVWRMVAADPNAPSKTPASPPRDPSAKPLPEQLQFKGHRYLFEGVKKGDVRVARFPFTNATDHVVRIEEIATGCECLQVKTTKMEYQPGESGQLDIEFNSAGYQFTYSQTIVVTTNPGEAPILLRIDAQVIPPGYTGPKPRETKPGAAATTVEKKP